MTKNLASFGDLAKAFTKNALVMMVAQETALAKAAYIVQQDAKARIGNYQAETGPFPGWAPLADSTELDKAAKNYPTNAPLLRTGEMMDSIVTEHSANEAIIGSKSKIAAYQEFGTNKIPPRPFIGPAAFDNRDRIAHVIGSTAASALAGNPLARPNISYDGGHEEISTLMSM